MWTLPSQALHSSGATPMRVVYLALVFCFASAIPSYTQTFTTLASFNSTNGSAPGQVLIQGLDGDFYGTAEYGGANGGGTIFKITATGKLTTIYSFCSQLNCADGKFPLGSLLLANDGNLYGTTNQGGAMNYGTVFKFARGALTTLYSFCSQTNCSDGYFPDAGLLQAMNGNFYGTTSGGGTVGFGTIFEITHSGKLTTRYNFCFELTCGQFPQQPLIQGTNGNFYGMTPLGGPYGWGIVFGMSPKGGVTSLYNFVNASDGGNPRSGLVQASNGDFYGTAFTGANGSCYGGCGTVFEITSAGQFTTLHTFCVQSNCADGANPYAGLVLATDGNLYGTTVAGGANGIACFGGCGSLFEITPTGQLTTLYSFCAQANCADGSSPYAGVLQATNGALYGTTYFGGASNECAGGCGTVFSLSVGLRPFVQPVSTSGKVGAKVILLGNNLTSTRSVSFNGRSATFTVVSDTEITTTVPTGATSGKLQVVTASGTLKSNVSFRVLP